MKFILSKNNFYILWNAHIFLSLAGKYMLMLYESLLVSKEGDNIKLNSDFFLARLFKE